MQKIAELIECGWRVEIDSEALTVYLPKSGCRRHRYVLARYRSLDHALSAAHAGEPPAREE